MSRKDRMFGRRKKETAPVESTYRSGLREKPYPQMLETSPAWVFIEQVLLHLVGNEPWRAWNDPKRITREQIEQRLMFFNEKYHLAKRIGFEDLLSELQTIPWSRLQDDDYEMNFRLTRTALFLTGLEMEKLAGAIIGSLIR